MFSQHTSSRRRDTSHRVRGPLAEMLESRFLFTTIYVDNLAPANGNGLSIATAYQTLQKGLNNVHAGDTIYVKGNPGSPYRDGSGEVQLGRSGDATNGYLTIAPLPGSPSPVFTGSDVVTGWVNHSGNIWKKTGWTTNSQQVFLNDVPLQQIGRPAPYTSFEYPNAVGSGLGDMAPGRFFYDSAATTLYIELPDGSDPNSAANAGKIEASVVDRLFFAEPSRGYIKLDSLIFKHSNFTRSQQQQAMVTVSSNSIVTNCTFEYADFAGLSLGDTTGVQVINNISRHNGDIGMQAPGSQDFLIQGNTITDNNYRHFYTDWHAGGIKVVTAGSYGVVEDNTIANNEGSGVWFDTVTGTASSVISNNYIHDNTLPEAGVFFEKSSHVLISNNVLATDSGTVNGNRRGIFISGSNDAKVYNNTIFGQQGRSGIEVLTETGGQTPANVIVKNNIIANGTSTYDEYLLTGTGNTSSNNDVYRAGGAIFYLNNVSKTLGQMQAAGFETGSTTADPDFASTTGADYSLNSTSPAKDTGTTLSEVTTDYAGTARPQGTAYDMGAYEYFSTLSTGLVGYWQFNEGTGTTTADASSTGNTATLQNGTVWSTPGEAGAAALSFDGVNDKAYANDDNTLDLTTGITIGGWFNHSSTGGTSTAGIQKLQAYRLTAQEANAASSHWQFFFTDPSGGTHQVQTTNAYSNDTWHYIIGTYDGTQLQIYVDGVAAATAVSYTGSMKTTTSALEFGHRDATAYYKGFMDEIRIYNRALTAAEIAMLYASNGTAV